MGMDFLLPAKAVNGDESLGAFVSRRLGREAYENLIEPLMSGIYAGDGDALSLASTFPYLRDLELKYGSLARGALSMKKQSNGKSVQGSRSAFLTPTTGLAEIVEALVTYLQANNVDLQLNRSAKFVTRLSSLDPWDVTLDYGRNSQRRLPYSCYSGICKWKIARLARPLRLLPIYKAFPMPRPLPFLSAYRPKRFAARSGRIWLRDPRRRRTQSLACTWTSTKFPHRAPEGYALLHVFSWSRGAGYTLE